MTVEEFISEMRKFETDHEPGGYPAVKMKDISKLCNIIERQRACLHKIYWHGKIDCDCNFIAKEALENEI